MIPINYFHCDLLCSPIKNFADGDEVVMHHSVHSVTDCGAFQCDLDLSNCYLGQK